jgi:hypothetical protein
VNSESPDFKESEGAKAVRELNDFLKNEAKRVFQNIHPSIDNIVILASFVDDDDQTRFVSGEAGNYFANQYCADEYLSNRPYGVEDE